MLDKNDDYLTMLETMITGNTTNSIEIQEKRGQQRLIHNKKLPMKTNDYCVPRDVRCMSVTEDMEYKQQFEIEKENNKKWTKEQYEKIGIKIVNEQDDLFLNVELSNGWNIKPTDHNMWSDLVDDKDRKRASIFYKAAFYDRDAFISFNRRFNISGEIADYNKEKFKAQPEFIIDGYKNIYEEEIDYEGNYIIRDSKKTPIMKKNPNYIPLTGYEKYSQPFHFEVEDHNGDVLFKSKIVETNFEYSKDKHWDFFQHRDELVENCKLECEEWLKNNYPNWKNFSQYWD